MAFAQLTYRESLRDIETCLSVHASKLYHMGFRQPVRRSTLADANERRDWRIHAALAQRLITQARTLYVDEELGLDLTNTVYALDSTTIALCLSVFPWAHFRTTKAAVKMHTLLEGAGAIRFTSAILPRYLRRTKSLEDLLPWLYLRGISSGDFSEALAALLGAQAPGLSASTIGRLKEVWQDEMERWQRHDLSAKRYVYFWVDGIYFGARLEEEKQCILVIIGATDHGTKELIAITDGYRESEQSWREVLLDLKRRGLGIGPELVTGDGALGFWKALRQVYGAAREQRCWVHKTGNILNKLPKGLQNKAKGHLQDIWMAETRKDAETAFDFFLEAYGPKYEKATACLAKDRDALLSFYDFPAEHWKHVRTTNPIESTFATVRLRTYRTKGCLSRKTAMAMVFKLCQGASKKWRRLNGSDQFAEIIRGVKFVNGKRQDRAAA